MDKIYWNAISTLYVDIARRQMELIVEFDRALGASADGLILLDRCGETTFLNLTAVDILSQGDGLSISSGLIEAKRAPESRKLARHIGNVLKSRPRHRSGQALLVSRPSGRHPYLVRVLPPQDGASAGGEQSFACVVQIHDLAYRRAPTDRILRETFGLTRRESDLAVQLVRTSNLQAAAVASGMAVNTARNHLRGLFLKTGTSTQSEIVQLLSKMP